MVHVRYHQRRGDSRRRFVGALQWLVLCCEASVGCMFFVLRWALTFRLQKPLLSMSVQYPCCNQIHQSMYISRFLQYGRGKGKQCVC